MGLSDSFSVIKLADRYNTRELNDTARMRRLMGQVAGRRLTYR